LYHADFLGEPVIVVTDVSGVRGVEVNGIRVDGVLNIQIRDIPGAARGVDVPPVTHRPQIAS